MAQMSNTQFAEMTGYHHSTVSRLRAGQRLPSLPQLLRLCDTFQLDVEKYVRAHVEGAAVFADLLNEEILSIELPEETTGTEG